MRASDECLGQPQGDGVRFATTHWSLVLKAGGADSAEARPAMTRLLDAYWYPLYAFVRRKGHGPEEACDLTQEFMARLLERGLLQSADAARGRFRTFLLTCLERFLIDEWTRAGRLKRGGARPVLSLEALAAENRYRLEPAETLDPERIYERRWALTLLERALTRLCDEWTAAGRETLFEELKPILVGEDSSAPYAELAARTGKTEGSLKTAVHRMRRRYGDLLRAEIAETVSTPEEVEEEIRDLFRVLSASVHKSV